ncbi:carnitine dehydratase [Chromatiales bacterium (ex Bugula neritina AB1)]|nr:carnitine dehydratase [Chromatiales bacterium (ex Bugula neritina AB1)]
MGDTSLPLNGIRVLEFGQIAAGPFAGSLLADLGADVVKVERPDGGDGMRSWPPLSENNKGEIFSENFASLNRNKRSITANLKNPDDVRHLLELSTVCDVVVENFRPGVLDKLGLGYQQLTQVNDKLIYCSISGYGQTGPYASKGAFDVTVQAMSGLMSVTGEQQGNPVKCGVPVGDFCAGLYAAYTILARTLQVRAGGKGGYIDCSMLGSLIGVSALQTSEYFGSGNTPLALGSAHPRNAPYRAFKASDEYFVVAAGNDKLWSEVAAAVGMPELAQDPRFITQQQRAANQDEMLQLLQPGFELQTADYWLNELDRRGVPCSPINDYPKILNNEHVKHLQLVQPLELPNGVETLTTGFPVSMSDMDFSIRKPPPELGSHNTEVASEWLPEEQ